jgi:hypothetical protein
MRSPTLIVSLLLSTACQQPAPATGAIAAAGYDQFGAGVEALDGVDVATVLAAPEQYDGKTLRLAGTVHEVCKKAGCWARIGGSPGLFVKMKDHAFFLPLDCEGRPAIVEGQLVIEEQSIEEVQHYLEDAGKHSEAAKVTAPRREVAFVAAGVALGKRGS